jgi:isochorismate pyruvate lyase
MCWSAPLSDSVTIDPRTAPEACASMAEVRHGVDALDRVELELHAGGQDAETSIERKRSGGDPCRSTPVDVRRLSDCVFGLHFEWAGRV